MQNRKKSIFRREYKSVWLKGNPGYSFDEKTSITKIDDILHLERIDRNKSKVTHEENIRSLPNCCFVLFNNDPYLIFNGSMYKWSPVGYEAGIVFPKALQLPVLTPKSIVNTFRAGYSPQIALAGV